MVPEMYWAIFGGIATVATALSAAVINWTKIQGIWKNVISWVLAIGLTYAAWAISLIPALGDPAWLWVGLQGICVGLVSNGIYDIPWVKKLYELIFGGKKKKEVEEDDD